MPSGTVLGSVWAVTDKADESGIRDRRWNVRPVRDDEFDAWSTLFRGYADFYQWELPESQEQKIWSWIHDERVIEALVAVAVDGTGLEIGPLVGLAHLRTWVRPLRGTVNGYLDDLFVSADERGEGAVDAIFRALEELAMERDWPVIRWTTAHDNVRAQHVYDRYATRTTWVTYDMDVASRGSRS
jgi:ribosomal protein S18 acetylase RimI-like enzyme